MYIFYSTVHVNTSVFWLESQFRILGRIQCSLSATLDFSVVSLSSDRAQFICFPDFGQSATKNIIKRWPVSWERATRGCTSLISLKRREIGSNTDVGANNRLFLDLPRVYALRHPISNDLVSHLASLFYVLRGFSLCFNYIFIS